jgi:hypothetical protein
MKIHVKGKKRHDTVFREKFGIGLYQYQTMLEQQNGVCYICGEQDFRNLAVDHDHKTGKVRRLLCTSCNIGLGKFKDDANLLRKAADYLCQEFKLPLDVPTLPKSQNDKPRWRNVIKTPDGIFASAEHAAKHYNVHATSIVRWCGMYEYFKDSKIDGWESIRTYSSLNDIKDQYGIKD